MHVRFGGGYSEKDQQWYLAGYLPYYKAAPTFSPEASSPLDRIHRTLLSEVFQTREWQELRATGATGDPVMSAMGAIALTDRILASLDEETRARLNALAEAEQELRQLLQQAQTLQEAACEVDLARAEHLAALAEQRQRDALTQAQQYAPLLSQLEQQVQQQAGAVRHATRQALRETIQTTAGFQHTLETLLLRAISQHPCVLALVKEQPDQQGGLSYATRLRARYDPGTQDVCCTLAPSGPIDASTEAPQVLALLRPLFAEACQTHTGEDLSRVLRAIITGCQAVRLQRGVYFVPVSESEPLRRLDALLTTLPGAPLLATLARLDERRTRERLVHAIHTDLTRELDGMESRLEQLCAGQPQPDPGVLCQHLVRFRAAQTRAQAYTELLGTRVQEINARLRHMQKRVQDLVLLDIKALIP